MGLQVRKAHLNPLSLVAGSQEGLGLHLGARHVASILVEIANDPARWHVWAALGLQCASPAVEYGGEVAEAVVGVHPATGRHRLPGWTHIDVPLLVEGEIEPGERSVIAVALVPDRNVRRDLLLFDQPAKKAANPVGRVSHEALRLEIEALLRAINHDLGRFDLIVGASGGCLNVDNHGILDVDKVVEAVAELHALVGLGSPGRGRV